MYIWNYLKKTSIYNRIIRSEKAKELVKNSFWSLLGAVLSKGLLFISWVIVARILGSDGYGQFGIIRSTVLMFITFAGFSLGVTASKHVAEFLQIDKPRIGRILGLTISFALLMGIILGIIFYLLAPWLATNTLNAPEIIPELRIGALILVFSSLNGAQLGALQGLMAFKKIAKINVIQALLSFPFFIFGALYWGVNGTVWAFAVSTGIICVLSHVTIKKLIQEHEIIIDYSDAWREKSLLFKYSLPAFLGGIAVTPIKWITDSLLVQKSGFTEMGLFTASLTLNSIILVGASMISAPFISIMAKNKDEKNNSALARINIIAPWALGIILSLPFVVFPELGTLIFGETYSGDIFEKTFTIILLFTIVLMFQQGLNRIIIVYDLQWIGFFSNIIWGVTLISSFLLFKTQDSLALAISYLIAYIVNTTFVLPIFFKKKLVPKSTIISLESLGIWFLLIIISFSGLLLKSIFMRVVMLVVSMLIFGLFFSRMFKEKIKN